MNFLTPTELVAILDGVQPLHLEAASLLEELYILERDGLLSSTSLALLQPDIDEALADLNDYVEEIQGVVERCSDLPAIPSNVVPFGF